jgi:hypothetical protein
MAAVQSQKQALPTPWKSRKSGEIPTFPQLRRRFTHREAKQEESKECGPWKSGNPKAGFPLSHGPGSLRQQGGNPLTEKLGVLLLPTNGDTSIEVTPGTFLDSDARTIDIGAETQDTASFSTEL